MNSNQQLIETFYAAFASQNAESMKNCYHENVIFQDPAFGVLRGSDVGDMWTMLIERSKGNLEIEFFDIVANKDSGSARWVAKYLFSRTNRNVVNEIQAQFEFKDGLIIRHTDHFDIWKWSKQALGLPGILLGWTGFMQKKIQQQAIQSLRKYQEKYPKI